MTSLREPREAWPRASQATPPKADARPAAAMPLSSWRLSRRRGPAESSPIGCLPSCGSILAESPGDAKEGVCSRPIPEEQGPKSMVSVPDVQLEPLDLSVVIPVYNSAEILPSLVDRLVPVL